MSNAIVEALASEEATIDGQYTLLVTWSIIVTGSLHLVFALVASVATFRRSRQEEDFFTEVQRSRYFDWVTQMSSLVGHQRLVVTEEQQWSSNNNNSNRRTAANSTIEEGNAGGNVSKQGSGDYSKGASAAEAVGTGDAAAATGAATNDPASAAQDKAGDVAANNNNVDSKHAPGPRYISADDGPVAEAAGEEQQQKKKNHVSTKSKFPASEEKNGHHPAAAADGGAAVFGPSVGTSAVHTSTRFTRRRSLYAAATEASAASAAQRNGVVCGSSDEITAAAAAAVGSSSVGLPYVLPNSALCLASFHRVPKTSARSSSFLGFLAAWWPLVVLILYTVIGIGYAYLRCALVALGIALVYNTLGIAMNTAELVIYSAVLVMFAMVSSVGRVPSLYAL